MRGYALGFNVRGFVALGVVVHGYVLGVVVRGYALGLNVAWLPLATGTSHAHVAVPLLCNAPGPRAVQVA